MPMTNRQLLQKIDTGTLSGGGIMTAEQAKQFFKMTFETTEFLQQARKEQRTAIQGELDKIAIGGRLLRKKVEDTDDGYRAGVTTTKVEYTTVPTRVPWELTEEVLRQNIEQEAFEDTVMSMMSTQIGIDLEDLAFNGDTASADPFININDGFVKLILNGSGSHLVDCSADTKYNKATLFKISAALPRKYKNKDLRWLMSPTRRENWIEYLTGRATGAGDAALIGAGEAVNRPLTYPIIEIPSLDDEYIILAQPKNFINVWTYNIRVRKTTEGKEAIMQDKRFYVIHFDSDFVVQEYDAVAMAYNLTATTLTD